MFQIQHLSFCRWDDCQIGISDIHLDGAKVFSLYDVWYARYPLSEKPTWNEQKYGKQLGMWQYSEEGKIDGISGNFDLNYAYKDYKEIMIKWGLNGF